MKGRVMRSTFPLEDDRKLQQRGNRWTIERAPASISRLAQTVLVCAVGV